MFYISMATAAFVIVLTAMQMEGRSGLFGEGDLTEEDMLFLKVIGISLVIAAVTLVLSREFWG